MENGTVMFQIHTENTFPAIRNLVSVSTALILTFSNTHVCLLIRQYFQVLSPECSEEA